MQTTTSRPSPTPPLRASRATSPRGRATSAPLSPPPSGEGTRRSHASRPSTTATSVRVARPGGAASCLSLEGADSCACSASPARSAESSGASTTGYDGPPSAAHHRATSSLSSAIPRDEAGATEPQPSAAAFDVPPIVELPVEDIRAFVQRALDGVPEEGWPSRDFKVNPPATDRPVRIYADGQSYAAGILASPAQRRLTFLLRIALLQVSTTSATSGAPSRARSSSSRAVFAR